MRRAVIIVLWALLVAVGVSAQERVLLSRSALDALVHPELSTKSSGLMAVDEHVNIGTIDDKSPCDVVFYVENTTNSEVAISAIRSSCSCLKVIQGAERVAAHSVATIKCSFNPAGRSGEFEVDMLLYTTLDTDHPALRLTLSGEVHGDDGYAHLSKRMGILALSRKSLCFDGSTEERIACANLGDKPLELSARSTVNAITLRTIPQVLQPGEEGEIVVGYSPEKLTVRELKTMLIVDGVAASAAERMIQITIKR